MFTSFIKHPLTKVICLVVVMTFTITSSAQNARANTLSFMNEAAIRALLVSWIELEGHPTEQTFTQTSIERLLVEEGIQSFEIERQSENLQIEATAIPIGQGEPIAQAEILVEKFSSLFGPSASIQYELRSNSQKSTTEVNGGIPFKDLVIFFVIIVIIVLFMDWYINKYFEKEPVE